MYNQQVKFIKKAMLMSLFAGIVIGSLITACTYSINMVHTEGTATDVIDETQAPKTDANLTIPTSVIP